MTIDEEKQAVAALGARLAVIAETADAAIDELGRIFGLPLREAIDKVRKAEAGGDDE